MLHFANIGPPGFVNDLIISLIIIQPLRGCCGGSTFRSPHFMRGYSNLIPSGLGNFTDDPFRSV